MASETISDMNGHLETLKHDHIQHPKQRKISEKLLDDDLSEVEEDEEFENPGSFVVFVSSIQENLSHFFTRHGELLKFSFYGTVLILFHIYLGFSIAYNFDQAVALLVLTIIAWLFVLYFFVFVPLMKPTVEKYVVKPIDQVFDKLWAKSVFRWIVYILILLIVVIYLAVDTAGSRYRLVSLSGLIFYMLILFIFSTNPARVNWRPVWWGLGLQVVFGLLVLRWSIGASALQWFSDQIVTFLDYTNIGTQFVYGYLAVPPNVCGMSPIFLFSSIQVVIYFGAVVGALYYFGIIQFIMIRLAWLMQVTMGTTAAESLNAAASVFLGMSEAPIMIRPYLIKLTTSELFAILVSGFSCIAGSLFAAYTAFGACPAYLLSASIMSAPASLGVAKLFFPETKKSKTKRVEDMILAKSTEKNLVEAISSGATNVIEVTFQIAANLIVFLALLGFVDAVITWMGDMVGIEGLTLEKILGYVFFPLAFLMGASDNPDWSEKIRETMIVAELMGIKTILNEFVAYQKMSQYIAQGLLSGRPQMIATYALCGFSNIGSVGITLGTIGGLCPRRKSLLASIALRALIAGSITCFMTACIAGILVENPLSCAPSTSGANCTKIVTS